MLAWHAILDRGVSILKLHPRDLWALTPYEFLLMSGLAGHSKPMTRDRLQSLMDAFPDEKEKSDE